MDIDQSAPLIAQQELEIYAPVEKVWSVISDIASWPKWQPEVASARLVGELANGSNFTWNAMGLNIHSQIMQLEFPNRIGWIGKSIGMEAVHLWTLESRDHKTIVTTRESLNGWVPRILKFVDKNFLTKSLIKSLAVLKAEAEKV